MTDQIKYLSYATEDDGRLQQKLGYGSLVAIGVGSVVGSGWLFSAMYAAQAAGPASIISWIIGGLMMLSLALVNAELGRTHPESGGLSRYPLYSNGRLTAALTGWCFWLGVVATPAIDSAGVMQYLNSYIPGLFDGTKLTLAGTATASALILVFFMLNSFGIKLISKSNNLITGLKIGIPIVAICCLIYSGFKGQGGAGGLSNFSDGGGFAPNGISASLSIIASAGILFAYSGFNFVVNMSGEAKNPRRNIPAALITTVIFTIILYVALQFTFLVSVPHIDVLKGWSGINYDSPYAQLAMIAGFHWLYWVLLADSVISPSGAAFIGITSNARNVFALAKNGFMPKGLQKIDPKWGVPRRALAVNFIIALGMLILLPAWHSIMGLIGVLGSFTLAVASISVAVFRQSGITLQEDRIRGMGFIALFAFVVSALIMTWVPWHMLLVTIPFLLIGGAWYFITYFMQKQSVHEIQGGLWLVTYFIFIYVMGYLGSFGSKIIPAPLDSIIVAVVAIFLYYWGVKSGVRYMNVEPASGRFLRESISQRKKKVKV